MRWIHTQRSLPQTQRGNAPPPPHWQIYQISNRPVASIFSRGDNFIYLVVLWGHRQIYILMCARGEAGHNRAGGGRERGGGGEIGEIYPEGKSWKGLIIKREQECSGGDDAKISACMLRCTDFFFSCWRRGTDLTISHLNARQMRHHFVCSILVDWIGLLCTYRK